MVRNDTGESVSLWMAEGPAPVLAPLATDLHVDVCVVGAGIAGMTTAYLLAREGRTVAVLDDGPVGGGQTLRTTAHLSNEIDDRYTFIEKLHGAHGAQLAAESHTAAIDCIERIVHEEAIVCDFERVDGYLFAPPGDFDVLDRELDAARRAGLAAVEMLTHAPLASFDAGPCLRFPRQGQLDPAKYLDALTAAIVRRGGRIYTNTHATAITGGARACVATARDATVTASAVVVATNTPVNDRFAIHTKQAPYMTYVVGLVVPRGAVPHALYWDTLDPYHYVRLHAPAASTDEVLIVGGEDHKTGQADDELERFDRLAAWARERFPMAGEVAFRWSGQVMETIDGLAFIGRNPGDDENVYVVTGDSGMGMTHGTIAGMLLTDLIQRRENRWAALYDPRRTRVRALGEFVGENVNVATRYAQWLTPGDVSSVDDVAPGCGAVMRSRTRKVAVYRDDDGVAHAYSAVCPHLGCIVAWNDAEHTWDCPCHGSRFDALGRVVSGPANSNLEPVEVAGERTHRSAVD